MSGFLDLEQMGFVFFLLYFFLFISMVDMWTRRFLSKDTLWTGRAPKFLKITRKAPWIDQTESYLLQTYLHSSGAAGKGTLT